MSIVVAQREREIVSNGAGFTPKARINLPPSKRPVGLVYHTSAGRALGEGMREGVHHLLPNHAQYLSDQNTRLKNGGVDLLTMTR
jgi:hypothetical protein